MNLHRSLYVAILIAATGFCVIPLTPALAADNLGGKPVPGVCMLSREAVFAQSKVGHAASARLGALADQARSQLASQRKPIDADIQSFEQTAPKLTEAQRKQQGAALQQRMQAFQAEAGQLNQRVQATQSKAMETIGEQAQTVVASSYQSHQCGLLLNRDAVLSGNMANDLTTDVVAGLDRKITTISFNLEPAPAAPQR
ncbi:MAG: OmpH family outer membrane protein [Rhodanobacter sp.]